MIEITIYPQHLITMSTKKRAAKKSAKTVEEPSIKECREKKIRERVVNRIHSIFELNVPKNTKKTGDMMDLSRRIEVALYEYIRELSGWMVKEVFSDDKSSRRYHIHLTSLVMNLDPNSHIKNKNLIGRVLTEDLPPDRLVRATATELFPEKWETVINKKKAEEVFLYERKIIPMSTEYTCFKCKQNKCSYYELQTRSADEQTTIFFTCLVCNNRWRIG